MYAYQMWASTFAYLRLRKGLPLTFEIRKQCAIETFKCLFVYAIYLSFMMFCFAIISSLDPNPPIGSSLSNFSLFLLFIISNRGSVDGFVWFMLHDFQRDKMINYKKIDDNNDNDNNNNDNNNNNLIIIIIMIMIIMMIIIITVLIIIMTKRIIMIIT